MTGLLILRPQPGAGKSAQRALEAGFDPCIWPLFEIVPRNWRLPEQHSATAILLTSANAARCVKNLPANVASLPAYCVGPATAREAADAGFEITFTGNTDVQAVVDAISGDGHRATIHFRGAEAMSVDTDLLIIPVIAYAAESVRKDLPESEILASHMALLHSSRAAARFAELVDEQRHDRNSIRIVAISAEVVKAVGGGWQAITLAKAPNDAAMMEAARNMAGG